MKRREGMRGWDFDKIENTSLLDVEEEYRRRGGGEKREEGMARWVFNKRGNTYTY